MAEPARIEVTNNGTKAQVTGGRAADLAGLQDMPDLRHVWLDNIRLTPAVLKLVAGLPHIAAVTVTGERLTTARFAILEGLPPSAAVRAEDNDHDDPAWNAFRRRRADQAARLGPKRRREAAERYAWGIASIGFRTYDPTGRRVEIDTANAGDDDLRVLRWLPTLEELRFHRCWGVTAAGVAHLAGHKRLRLLHLNGPRITASLKPLARCPALEELVFSPEYEPYPGDPELDGVERLTGLRVLLGDLGSFTEATLARVAKLTRLRRLMLSFHQLGGADALRHLSGLHELEALKFTTSIPLTAECLRHLAGLKKLQYLFISIKSGDGDGLKHLSGMKELRFLTLFGEGTTDSGLQHLKALPGLKLVDLAETRVTPAGAKALAAALPEVAVHLEEAVFKSRQPTVRFRREVIEGFVSALIPVRWHRQSERGTWEEDGYERFEDGWDDSGSPSARILLWVEDEPKKRVEGVLKEVSRNSAETLPKRFEVGKLLSGKDSASAAFPRDGSSCLAGAALHAGRAGIVQGEADPKRFKELHKLYEFVVASLRVGPDALAAEEIKVRTEEFE